jgi:rhodanese-related sulfurtransferase
MPRDISPQDLKALLDNGDPIVILDVRETWEVEAAALPGIINIPMDDIPASLERLPRDIPVVVMCHTGSRSGFIAQWLEMRGYANVLNLLGGIDRWSLEVDRSIPRY